MFNKKSKEIADKELALYKEKRELEINRDIQNRKEKNWSIVDEARQDRMSKLVEIVKLEAKAEVLGEEVAKRESEVQWLRNVVLEAVLGAGFKK